MSVNPALAEQLERVIVRRQFSPRAAATYRESFRRCVKAGGPLTAKDLRAFKPKDVAALVQKLSAKYRPATVKLAITALRAAWRQCHLDELVESDPFVSMDRIRLGNNVPEWNVLQPGELERLVAELEGDERAAVLLMGRMGLRLNEVLALRWENVRTLADGSVALVFLGKGGKEARLRVPPDVWAAVNDASGQDERNLRAPVLHLSRQKLQRCIRTTTQRVLKHRVTPHGLRATFVSQLIAKRGIEAARQGARHSSITTTQRYSRWSLVDVEEGT